ncbi:hypothetical protein DFH27DRAFT_244908 [Peziza echinospora]|nr:hypothetical protein DFH27DRAFT_244908 [Peziza echinospora]
MGSRTQGYLHQPSLSSLRGKAESQASFIPQPLQTATRQRATFDADCGDGPNDQAGNGEGQLGGLGGPGGLRSFAEGSYEAGCVGFAKYLNSPMTSLVAGRGATQITYLIHTSILQPHPLLYKLCKAPAAASRENVTDLQQSSTPNTQVLLKDYDSQIVSSLLAFLYTNEYWPELPLLRANGLDVNGTSRYQGPTPIHGEQRPIINLFTAHNITIHHFRLALLASKFSIESLLLMCREKVVYSLKQLPPPEMLDIVKTLYSKDYVYREQFFELITYP